MKKHILLSALSALALVSTGTMFTSCQLVGDAIGSVRSIDMSTIPGGEILVNAQKDMMEVYGQSTELILKSRLSAVNALVLDAEAVAANEKAGEVYESARKIAAQGREKQKMLQAHIENITNAQDFGELNKVKEETESVDKMIAEGYSLLSSATKDTNAKIAATNKEGDMYIAQSMQHQADAVKMIELSYSQLQDAQIMELKLAATAVAQTTTLVKAMEGASPLTKGLLAAQFRPILYFITGLPGEFAEQNEVCAMWEQHSAQSGITLNTRKIGGIENVTAKAAEQLKGAISLDSFVDF